MKRKYYAVACLLVLVTTISFAGVVDRPITTDYEAYIQSDIALPAIDPFYAFLALHGMDTTTLTLATDAQFDAFLAILFTDTNTTKTKKIPRY